MIDALKIHSIQFDLPKENAKDAFHEVVGFLTRHPSGVPDELDAKVTVSVKCKNGKQRKCEITGRVSAEKCVTWMMDNCREGGTATVSWG